MESAGCCPKTTPAPPSCSPPSLCAPDLVLACTWFAYTHLPSCGPSRSCTPCSPSPCHSHCCRSCCHRHCCCCCCPCSHCRHPLEQRETERSPKVGGTKPEGHCIARRGKKKMQITATSGNVYLWKDPEGPLAPEEGQKALLHTAPQMVTSVSPLVDTSCETSCENPF